MLTRKLLPAALGLVLPIALTAAPALAQNSGSSASSASSEHMGANHTKAKRMPQTHHYTHHIHSSKKATTHTPVKAS